jgi:hypothetical protein
MPRDFSVKIRANFRKPRTGFELAAAAPAEFFFSSKHATKDFSHARPTSRLTAKN